MPFFGADDRSPIFRVKPWPVGGGVPWAFVVFSLEETRGRADQAPTGDQKNPKGPPELFKSRCRSVVTNPIPNANNTDDFSEILTNFPTRNTERKGTRPNPMAEKKQSKMESTPIRNGAERGGVPRSRDSKDFFEEKQLVTLRAQH
ncbi:hypothetical protein NDU88_002316 [Pleurodeles waltl]|uniref:Uncharacterized protein n=1 Tax=Pleurodeles waltl TaxID=8319 RepID=A0AAV7T2U5_PLEWA|nr:hypothetical protein NDU88_002316 [Pleurodeles waltl]